MVTMINVLVADDEPPAVAELAFLLRQDDRIASIFEANSGAQALAILAANQIDAAFLDIHMPGLSGLDLAKVLAAGDKQPAVVFVTADEDHALAAFDVAAVDYLLKPVRRQRLTAAVGRLCELTGQNASKDAETITVDQGGVSRFIALGDVSFVQAQGDYARLHTAETSYLIRVPLSELEQRWNSKRFVRIHRSYLVCLDHVAALKLSSSKPTVEVAGVELPVSRRHLPTVRERLETTRLRSTL